VQHLGANAIEHCEADIGAILRGIDVNAKRSLSELGVDNIHDRLGDGAGVGIGRTMAANAFWTCSPKPLYGGPLRTWLPARHRPVALHWRSGWCRT